MSAPREEKASAAVTPGSHTPAAPVTPVTVVAPVTAGAPAAQAAVATDPEPIEQDGAATGARSAPERLSFGQRFSDRLNPILVREMQQAMSGRTFLAALVLSLGAILLVALLTAYGGGSSRQAGWRAFVLSMQVLTPVLTLIVPMQAFLSMRQEVAAGTVEHLLLSRLSPGAIVRGKIAAAFVESLLFFSLFAPLIALTYLLRGVDVPSIVITLGLTIVYAVGASTFSIAMGSLSRAAAFRALPLIVVALGLTMGTIALVGAMDDVLPTIVRSLRRADAKSEGFVSFSMPVLVSAPLLYLVAASALAHPYENRSTPFRALALVGFFGLFGWTLWVYESSLWPRRVAELAAFCAPLSAPFWIFAVTEEERLSPRVKTLVPKNGLLAGLSVPFLPGGARGFLWVLLFGVAACLCLAVGPWSSGYAPAHPWHAERMQSVALAAWAYVAIYGSLGRLFRHAMPAGNRGTVYARIAMPLLIAVLAVLPALLDLLVSGRSNAEGVHHLLNPFETIYDIGKGGHSQPLHMLLVGALIAIAVQIPSIARGVQEVMKASAARRKRASKHAA